MQNIVAIRDQLAIVQVSDFCYTDTYENYLRDGFNPLPEGVTSIDYNEAVQHCIINDQMQDDWRNEWAANVLKQLPQLREAFTKRQQADYEAAAQKAKEDYIKSITLDQFKQERLQELDQISARFEDNLNKDMYFVSSNGFKCNGDRRTKSNLQDIITFFDLQAQGGKVMYRDYNNVERELTREQVQVLLVEHVANGNALYSQKWALQEKINAAKSKDALKKLKLEFAMSDFSKQPVHV